jgi:hypothetical protein
MKKYLIFIISLIVMSFSFAEDININQTTSTPINARYEIIQSTIFARNTFRLDRFTGHVSVLAMTPSEDIIWDNMEIIDLPKIKKANKPRFQIFTSGLAARFTFLIDTETGKTWQQVIDEDSNTLWQPL